ncbi:MAG: UDP-glucose 4-epimerase GalE [Mycoplasma sp.]|nr:UDP-glucose 4-epimerase GalE [Candidatus Hennigella equi]
MTILNIGGAGFIGSVATELFIKNGHKVIVLDDLSTGFKKLVHPKAVFVKGSMLNYNLLDKIFKKYKIDVVTLYAAKIVVPESVAHPNDYYLTNVGGTATVLKAMHANNVKNIIFASSAAVYGVCKKVPVDEKSPTVPCNPYGASKLMCERLLIDANKAHGTNFISFRFFNVAGASKSGRYGMMKQKPSLLIPAINDCVLKHKTVSIFGNKYKTKDGTCLRDYIHVSDLANAALLALDQLKKNKSGIYCLGSNSGYTVLEVVKNVEKLIDKNLKYEFKPNRAGDPDALITSNKKAYQQLGWKVKHSLKDMIVSDYNFRKTMVK